MINLYCNYASEDHTPRLLHTTDCIAEFEWSTMWACWTKARVVHLVISEKLVFAITSKMLRILTEYIDKICSLEAKLFFDYVCSIRIHNILEVIAKTSLYKITKYSTLTLTAALPALAAILIAELAK